MFIAKIYRFSSQYLVIYLTRCITSTFFGRTLHFVKFCLVNFNTSRMTWAKKKIVVWSICQNVFLLQNLEKLQRHSVFCSWGSMHFLLGAQWLLLVAFFNFIYDHTPVLHVHRGSYSVNASHPFSVQPTQSQSIVPYIFRNPGSFPY